MEFQAILIGVELVAGVLLAILYIKSRLPKETIEQQTKLISALEGRVNMMEQENKILLGKHIENEKAIATLEGQIKVYKELPLQDIAKSLKALENIPSEFERIGDKNRDQIINAVKNINVQHVKNQTVEHETVKERN